MCIFTTGLKNVDKIDLTAPLASTSRIVHPGNGGGIFEIPLCGSAVDLPSGPILKSKRTKRAAALRHFLSRKAPRDAQVCVWIDEEQ